MDQENTPPEAPRAYGRFGTAIEYYEAAETLRRTLDEHGRSEWSAPVRLVMQLLYETSRRFDFMAELKGLHAQLARLEVERDQARSELATLQAQAALLEKMIGAGGGESLGDETCGFIDGDDVPCTRAATHLLIDPSGVRCPVCEEHERTAPPGLRKVMAS